MKSRTFTAIALASGLVVGGLSIPARAAIPEQNALRAKAQAELAAVTLDVDKAESRFPLPPGWVQRQYQDEFLLGRQSFRDANYSDALEHLRKADDIIRRQPDWHF